MIVDLQSTPSQTPRLTGEGRPQSLSVTFRLIGINSRPSVRKASAVRAGVRREMDAGMPSSMSCLPKPTVASVPASPSVRPPRGSAAQSISGLGSYMKCCSRRANASRRQSSKPNIRNERAWKARSHKQCEHSAYGKHGISARLKRICSTWQRRRRSTWNAWLIGSLA